MIKRRFYRLDEISDVTRLTKGDLFDAVERGYLCLNLWVNLESLGVWFRWKDSKRPSLANIFDYRGVVTLTSNQSINALQAEKYSINSVIITEPEMVKNWRTVSGVYPNALNNRFEFIYDISSPPEAPFNAYSFLTTRSVIGQKAKDLVKKGANEVRKIGWENAVITFLDMDEELYPDLIEVDQSQIRFDLEAVKKIFGSVNRSICDETTQNSAHLHHIVDTSEIETHPIKIMINRVMLGNGNVDTRTIWNAIKQDHKADTREIDVDSIINNMTNDEIEWFGQEDTVRTMKYKTFKNYVTTAKNNQN